MAEFQDILEWAREIFPAYVDDIYDDPFWECGSAEDVKREIERQQAIADELGLDYEAVVVEVTTTYERRRVAYIVEHGEDLPLTAKFGAIEEN